MANCAKLRLSSCTISYLSFVLIHFTCTVQSDQSASSANRPPTNEHAINTVLSATTIACIDHVMYITIRREKLMEIGMNEDDTKISFTDSPACRASPSGHSALHFKMATSLSECGTVHMSNPHIEGDVYHNEVTLQRTAEGKEDRLEVRNVTVQLSCHIGKARRGHHRPLGLRLNHRKVLPTATIINRQIFQPATLDRSASMSMQLYNTPYSSDGLIQLYPRDVPIGQEIFIEIRFSGSHAKDEDIRPMPIDCYFSPMSEAKYTPSDMQWLLRSTCPYHNSVSIVDHSLLPHDVFRMSYKQTERQTDRPYIFLHCKVGVCSARGARHAEGIADCPPADECLSNSMSAESSHRFPRPEQHPLITYLSSGPMKPVVRAFHKYDYDGSDVSGVHKKAVVEDYQNDMAADGDSARVVSRYEGAVYRSPLILVQGVTTGVVIFIAFVSFTIGMVLVGALWCIHETYNPYNKHGSNVGSRTNVESTQNYGIFYPPSQSSLPLLETNKPPAPQISVDTGETVRT